ncbi:iron ABC transporter permease [Actinomyces sp. zg-332]|uniref:ABC transporter permease n=1 Tax=Actinomyces sp. zg-332 TaxID=2708340 RepID=UPI00142126F2|nr:iron ABC transporter permease [Actinomyces sp. zg-332]QPK94219.1 iron ABC transporter permease [Actinomyces sp. zg-332]
MALIASFFSVILGLPLAYVFYRLDFKTRKFWRSVIMIPFVLPTTVVGVAFRSLFAENGVLGFLKLDGTVTAIIIAMVFFNLCVVVRIVGVFWQGIDPRFADVARLLGASKIRIFNTITFPALLPSIISSFCVVFLFCATSFGVVLVMGGASVSTLETQIYILTTQFLDLKTASVLSILQIILVAFLLVFSSKFDTKIFYKQKLYSGKTNSRNLMKPSSFDWGLIVSALIIVLFLIITPIAVLVVRSFTRNGEFTFENYINLFSQDLSRSGSISVFEAMQNSLIIALVAGFISTIIGFLVSFVLSRQTFISENTQNKELYIRQTNTARNAFLLVKIRKFLARIIEYALPKITKIFDMLFILPLGISAATVGFGFLITVNVLIYDTAFQWWLVPFAQATVAVPLVIKSMLPVVRGIDRRQLEVACLLGASPMRRFITIESHYFIPAILNAFGLALVVSFGEFGATSFLFRSEGATLPVMIYSLIGQPTAVHQGMANASCVVLSAFVCFIVFLGQKISR